MGTPAYRGCPLRDAPFSGSRFAGGATHGSAAERATDVFREDHPYWVYAGLTLVLQSRYGAGLATSSPPPRNGGPAFFVPLFTEVPRRRILRTSRRGGSRKGPSPR